MGADTQPFQRPTPDEIVSIEVTLKEKFLIEVLRQQPFGKITVHKASGQLIRLEVLQSILIKEEDGKREEAGRSI